MIKKIPVARLVPGMYVEDTGLTWHEHPFLFTHAGMVRDPVQVERILAEGYLDVFINTDKGLDDGTVRDPDFDDLPALEAKSKRAEPGDFEPTEALEKEMPEARRIFSESIRYAKSFMGDARLGKPIDFAQSGIMVDSMLDSIGRNATAMLSLAKLKAGDEYTFTHCINVSLLSALFGRYLGFDRKALRRLGLAGLFHDLGKAKVPGEVLNKPGKLTGEEFALMKRHPSEGFLMMRAEAQLDQDVMRGALEHHEKHDGSGYPKGLAGENIGVFARIISVADVYDALTSARVYKKGMAPNQALRIVYELKDSNFYPGHVEKFIKCLGIYPLGSFVKLSNGEYAVVVGVHHRNTLHPAVKVVCDADLKKTAPKFLDLAESVERHGDRAIKIVDSLDPRPLNLDLSSLDE